MQYFLYKWEIFSFIIRPPTIYKPHNPAATISANSSITTFSYIQQRLR